MKRSLSIAITLLSALAAPAALFAQEGSAASAAASAVAKDSSSVTLWNLFSSGGWAMVPLGAMSILTVMLIFVYLITLRRGAVLSNQFMNTAEVLLKKQDYAGLLAIAHRHSEAVARIVHRMLDFAAKNPGAPFEVVREIAQTEGATQAASLQNRIAYLADIAVLSPMVGLLGTVFGIIQSFGVLASASTTEHSRPVLLAHGVSEALVATGTGLVIGITAMAFYGFFRNKVQNLLSELERASAHLLGLLSLQFEGQPSSRREEPAARPEAESRPETRVREFRVPPRRRPTDPQPPSVSVEDEF
ncbi:MAG: MotA/TolQ/ExbB proton channel family protein [Chthoniobacteraceae bacterium]|nr:MotA/TolQ/ExbB proton channel family protein [Chthoniobacteraceae bacterium]